MNHIFSKCPDFTTYGIGGIYDTNCLWCLQYYLDSKYRDHTFTNGVKLKIKKLEYDKSFENLLSS